MTWKWAAVDLFYRRGESRHPGRSAHRPTRKRVLRAFVRALPTRCRSEYVFGLDMGLTESGRGDHSSTSSATAERPSDSPRALGGVPYDQLGRHRVRRGGGRRRRARSRDRPRPSTRPLWSIQGFGAVGQPRRRAARDTWRDRHRRVNLTRCRRSTPRGSTSDAAQRAARGATAMTASSSTAAASRQGERFGGRRADPCRRRAKT